MKMRIALGAAALGLLGSAPAAAQTAAYLVDQSATSPRLSNGNPQIAFSTFQQGPIGQSFTPTLPGVNFVTFTLAAVARNPALLSVSLYLGATGPVNGTLLGQTNTVTIPNSFSYVPVEFDFSSLIVLTPGSIYSLVFNNPGCVASSSSCESDGSVAATTSDVYPGGTAIRQAQSQAFDLEFSEGIKTAIVQNPSVPEPASWSMMLLGFGGMGYAMRRRTKVSTRVHFA